MGPQGREEPCRRSSQREGKAALPLTPPAPRAELAGVGPASLSFLTVALGRGPRHLEPVPPGAGLPAVPTLIEHLLCAGWTQPSLSPSTCPQHLWGIHRLAQHPRGIRRLAQHTWGIQRLALDPMLCVLCPLSFLAL